VSVSIEDAFNCQTFPNDLPNALGALMTLVDMSRPQGPYPCYPNPAVPLVCLQACCLTGERAPAEGLLDVGDLVMLEPIPKWVQQHYLLKSVTHYHDPPVSRFVHGVNT
jgi:hypothetical protein